MNQRRNLFWVTVTIIFLLITASRLIRLNDLTMNRDEIWSVWQTFAIPAQIIRWTPYDWPPLYNVTLGAWRSLVALDPVILRAFSALVFPLGVAFLFRMMRCWRGDSAEPGGTEVWAASDLGCVVAAWR